MHTSPSKAELIERGFAVLCRFIIESPENHHFRTLQSWLEGDVIESCGLPSLRQVVVALVHYARALEQPVAPGSEAFDNLRIAGDVLSSLREHFLAASELYAAEVAVRRKLPDAEFTLSVAEVSVARFPGDWACLCGLAGALRDLRRPDDALAVAERAFALNGRDGSPLYDAGWAFLEANRAAEASHVFERVSVLFPQYPDIARALQLARQAMGVSTP